MPNFSYRAINRSGQTILGQIDADSAQAASAALADQGLYVDTIAPLASGDSPALAQDVNAPARQSRLRLREKDRLAFIRQLATALQAQLPLVTALETVAEQNPSPIVSQLAHDLAQQVRSGRSLSQACAHYPKIFDDLHVSMIAVGENVGALDRSVAQLADLSERETEARASITTAALYPAFVLALGLLSVAIVVTWILPRILATLGADVLALPWPTRILMTVGEFLKGPGAWVILGGAFLLVVLIGRWKRTPTGRYAWDSLTLRIPILGPVKEKWAIARFARTLGTLGQGGVQILSALHIVRNSLGNEVLARQLDRATKQVRSGTPLANALSHTGRFPPLLLQIIHMGEQTGRLAELLNQAADSFDRDSQRAIKRFMALFPAILILILAVLIGFIVAATLLPILQIETAIPGL